jgi:hypothetical protein
VISLHLPWGATPFERTSVISVGGGVGCCVRVGVRVGSSACSPEAFWRAALASVCGPEHRERDGGMAVAGRVAWRALMMAWDSRMSSPGLFPVPSQCRGDEGLGEGRMC